MAIENVARFEELLREDEALKAKLDAATAAYAGDASDDKAVFEAIVAPLAEEAGLPFTYEEGKKAYGQRELSDAELDSVAGGGGFCYLIGGSDDVNANCNEPGYFCAYIGVSAGGADL